MVCLLINLLEKSQELSDEMKLNFIFPDLRLCGDNLCYDSLGRSKDTKNLIDNLNYLQNLDG